ncbi:hypothetical protein AKO1_007100, partial [Acrasis kona]
MMLARFIRGTPRRLLATKSLRYSLNMNSRTYTTSSIHNQHDEEHDEAEDESSATKEDVELEVKDPQLIFEGVIKKLTDKLDGDYMLFPKEIYFLLGAPGAGKGTMTQNIMRERGLTAKPIVTSDLLDSPEMRKLKDTGHLISDKQVVELVFNQLLKPEYENGVIVDGFPRTVIQAHCVSYLYDMMQQLRRDAKQTIGSEKYPRPVFRITVLFVDEQVSVRRQLARGRHVRARNKVAIETGIGPLHEERATDDDEEAARQRYKFFRDSIYESLKLLQQKFDYNFIDASGDVQQVSKNVIAEFAYQSSVELAKETFDMVAQVTPAEDVIIHARQQLVKRLDMYQTLHAELFKQMLHIIKFDFLNIIKRQALSGVAIVRSENQIFNDPLALDMVLDILTERGYHVVLDYERKTTPISYDPITHDLTCETKKLFHFEIQFSKPRIR